MSKLYRVTTNSQYDENNACYVSMYWTLNNFIKFHSLYKFLKNDIVEVKDIQGNVVDIYPVFNKDESQIVDKALVTVSPTVPLDPSADYKFSSKNSDILIVLPVEHNGNKSYILLLGVPLNQKTIVTGYDANKKDKLEFVIESFVKSRQDVKTHG